MSQRKIEFRYFTVMDYEREAAYLRKRHREGWKLSRVYFPGVYCFESCAPEDVAYQLDYNQEGTQNKTEYVQMFRDCGWEYLQDFFGYSYFRKPVAAMDGREAIFCDDASRLDMMRRVFRGRMLPLLVLFFAVLIPQSLLVTRHFGFFSPFPIIYAVLLLLYLWIFTVFSVKYRFYAKRVKDGGGHYDL